MRSGAPDKCSAFVATGRSTRDGRPVIAHNNWSGYLEGSRWNVIFDIRPAAGHRILMDGMPGLIHSGDDFGINSAGLAITETTITGFKGFDPAGIPEFVRARKAMQYAASIDDFDRIMRDGQQRRLRQRLAGRRRRDTGEIARLELGLRNVTLERTRDGYFAGANFPVSPKLAAEETKFKLDDPSLSANARRVRAEELLKASEGKIDVALAKRYLSDHHDAYEKKDDAPSERTLCGHVDLSPRGMGDWFAAWGPAGTVQSKVADAAMVQRMSLEAAMGHPCGTDLARRPPPREARGLRVGEAADARPRRGPLDALRGALDPAAAAEPGDHPAGGGEADHPEQRVGVRPVELREVAEVHPVDPGEEGQGDEDRAHDR